jgi:precorrin-3B C17-methyltransferase
MNNGHSLRVNQVENLELFLLNLRYREGRLIDVSANKPLLLNDPEKVWIVYSGMVDVFSTPIEGDEVTGMRTHLFRSQAGQVLFGMPTAVKDGKGTGLLVSGIQARLLGIKRQRFLELAAELEYRDLITTMLDDWVSAISMGMATRLAPKDAQVVGVGELVQLPARGVVIPSKPVLWLRMLQGTTVFLNRSELGPNSSNCFVPFSKYVWLCVMEQSVAEVIDTESFVTDPLLWGGLDRFHQQALTAVIHNINHDRAAEVDRMQNKAESERQVMENALMRLTAPLANGRYSTLAEVADDSSDTLLATCRVIGKTLNIPMQSSAAATQKQTLGQALDSIANASRVRLRAAAAAGFVIALYNPVSKARPWQLGRAFEVLGEALPGETAVIFGHAVGRPDEAVAVRRLDEARGEMADMATCVIVGTAETRRIERTGMSPLVYTPRSAAGAVR